jgi:tetratricopeptide (TPR) repeat protein
MKRLLYITLAALTIASCAGPQQTVEAPTKKQPKGGDELASREQYQADYMFYEGNKERILSNWEKAAENYGSCLEIDHDNHAAMYEMSLALFHLGKIDEAKGFIELAVEFDDSNPYYQQRHAEMLMDLDDATEAAEVYKKMVKAFPDKADYYFDYAYALLMAKEMDEAVKVYDQIQEKMGPDPEISIQKYNIYLQMGKQDAAREEIEKLIELLPSDLQAWGILADMYQEDGETEKALAAYQKILEIDPNNGLVHLSLANHYEDVGNREKSHEELRIAFENAGLEVTTKVNILNSYFQATENSPELKDFCLDLGKIMLRVHPRDAEAATTYGNYLYRDNKLEEARAIYRKAASLDGGRYMIWAQILAIDSEIQDNESLKTDSEQAMELFPTQPYFYLYNGMANKYIKEWDAALESFLAGKELVFDQPSLKAQFYTEIGDCYHGQEDHPKSDEAYERSLKLEPSNSYVMNNYAYYLALRKENLERAEELGKKASQLNGTSASVLDTYGYILFVRGKYDEAKVQLQLALDKGGSTSGVILEHFGDVLFKLDKKEQALSYWEKAKAAGSASDLIDKKIADKQLYE